MSLSNKMLPYLLVCALAFYIIPLIGIGTGGFMSLLLIAAPIICFVVSFTYGMINKFQPLQLLFPIYIGILFVPTLYILYNNIAWVYAMAYTAIFLFGNVIGYVIAMLVRRLQ